MAAKVESPGNVLLMGHSIVLGASGPTYTGSLTLPGNVTYYDALNTGTIVARAAWQSSADGSYEPGMLPRIAANWTQTLTLVRMATSGAAMGAVLNTQFIEVQRFYTVNGLPKPDALYLGIGENDAQNTTEADLMRDQLRIFFERVHAWSPNTRIFLQQSVLDNVAVTYPEMDYVRTHQSTVAGEFDYVYLVPRTGITTMLSINPHWTLAGQDTGADSFVTSYAAAA